MCVPLTDSESIQEVHVAKYSFLSHRRDLMHIKRHFTIAARVVNAGNVGMMRSEIALRITVHAWTP